MGNTASCVGGVVQLDRSTVHVKKLLLCPALVKPHDREDDAIAAQRLVLLLKAWKTRVDILDDSDVSVLRELFGAQFLTDTYAFNDLEVWGAD